MKSTPVAACWRRCAVMENSKTRRRVVEGLRVESFFFFFCFLMVDGRRACSFADGVDD